MNKFLKNFININYKKPARALDLGCGRRKDLNYLKQAGWKMIGVDLPKTDLNYPYKNQRKFDLVYSNHVLQFIKNQKTFVETCFENLKKNGSLFIITFGKKDKAVQKTFTKQALKKLFSSHFTNIEINEKIVTDNHQPLGKHQHHLLILSAKKKTND